VRGIGADSPGDYAWYVNFNNGNSNYNNQNNEFFVRAVCASEYRGAPSFRALHAAWREARRGKCSANQLRFESHWIDGLLEIERNLIAGTWMPQPTICSIAKAPKAREIHAPAFADRIQHHWLVPQLEAIYEPRFIFDSYSNRIGKGTHAAVARLRAFVRQVEHGQGAGWYLQLDVANFFNSIHRPTLWAMLKRRMERFGLPLTTRQATHSLLRQSPIAQGVVYACTAAERAAVPPHKRLENAAPGCGIAIGNLSSQFFANVYLDALDQFVKHELHAPRYLRYVDDFVLVHQSRQQLEAWKQRIANYLRQRLRLELKADVKLRPLSAGIDFLGYVVFPARTVVRRRVVGHAFGALGSWQRRHIRGVEIRATPCQLRELRSIHDSYAGHFRHANSWRLRQRIRHRFPWLETALLSRYHGHQNDHLPISITYGEST
jgi:retron-type reverse transcriptase